MSCQLIVVFVVLFVHLISGQSGGGYKPSVPSTCQLMKCQNGGKCVIRDGFPVCECPEGYHGLFCNTKKIVDPCLLYSCFNGGTCKSNYGKAECQCASGYKGDHCELTPICPNYSNKNCKGKFCSKDSHCPKEQLCCTSSCGGSRCTDPNYESSIDICSGLCFNGGQCVYVNDRLSCKCQPGFQGDRCQSKAVIDTRTCPAVTIDRSKYCVGKRCEGDSQCQYSEKCCLSECGEKTCQKTDPNPCKNYCYNSGDCYLVGSEPRCACAAGYTGKHCDQLIPSHGGSCPNPRRLSVCFEQCAVDAHCPGHQKCCKTSCGGSVCSDPVPEPDIEKPCQRTVCPLGQMCRVIYYGDTERAEERCVPETSLPDVTDWSCKNMNYDNVILMVSDTDPDDYSPMKCDGPPPTRRCLNNSYCVDDGNNGGICCRGNMFPLEPVRPGTCPSPQSTESLDKGIICQVDEDCPGKLKCCNAPCGGKMCQTPETKQETCKQNCQKGYFCDYVKKTPTCPTCPAVSAWECVALNCSVCTANEKCISAGTLCNERKPYGSQNPGVCREAFTCSYKPDPCGGCQTNEVCVDTGLKCSTLPCDTFVCVPKDLCGGCGPDKDCMMTSYEKSRCVDRVDYYDSLVSENYCQKCKLGEVCVDTGLRCVKAPCPSFKCVKAETVQCSLPCDRLHICKFETPGCTYHPDIPCQKVPIPKCHPIMVLANDEISGEH